MKWAAAFDMDWVVVNNDAIRFISTQLGKGKQAEEIEKQYYEKMGAAKTEDEMDRAAESVLHDWYAQLYGLGLGELREILSKAPLSKGAKECIQRLHENGVKIIFISATLVPIAKILAEVKELPVDHFICSECDTASGKIGKPTWYITPRKKGEKLKELLDKLGITPDHCFAIGDSISEKHMFHLVGKENSIGFNYRQGLEKEVGHTVYKFGDENAEMETVADIILGRMG